MLLCLEKRFRELTFEKAEKGSKIGAKWIKTKWFGGITDAHKSCPNSESYHKLASEGWEVPESLRRAI